MSESRPKDCSHCHLPISVHLTKVVNGEAFKQGVCANCPKVAGLGCPGAWDLLEGGAKPQVVKSEGQACRSCGLTPEDFKESGRLGCPSCYEAFAAKLEPVISKLHRGGSHLGKAPAGQRRVVTAQEIEALKLRLREYVSREDFEMAAAVRDQINALKSDA